MIFLLAGLAFIVTGLFLGHVLTVRPWWSFFALREAASVAVVLALGARDQRRVLAMVLRARAEAAAPPCRLPALPPEKTLITGYITDRDYNRGTGRGHLERAARVTGAASVRGHAGPPSDVARFHAIVRGAHSGDWRDRLPASHAGELSEIRARLTRLERNMRGAR